MLSVFFLWSAISAAEKALSSNDLDVVAHRGASGYTPENTMAAFDLAVSMGSDFIEFDVHMSKDGVPVVIHDETLDKTTDGSGYVKDFTLRELKALDAGSSFNAAYAGEKIPSLQEVMDRYSGKVGILIELKKPSLYPGIEEIVADIVQRYENKGPIMIQSFEQDSIRKIHALLPDLPVAVLISDKQHPLTDDQLIDISSYASYINYDLQLLDEGVVKGIKAKHCKIMAWTIREGDQIAQARKLKVDGIITDYPDWILYR
nr:glycerophosphodiester phosphodiesterase family protein [Paenibacillus caui]